MSIPGRNDPCPCGSGRKYKNCCIHNAPSLFDGPISFPPSEEAIEDNDLMAELIREFLAERGERDFESMEQLTAELKDFILGDNAGPVDPFEGLTPDQMNVMLFAPLNSPETIRIADRVEAGPDVPVLMMLDEMRRAIEAGKDVSCTPGRELQPKLASRIYNKFRRIRPFDGLLERVRVHTETDAPIVHTARAVLEVSGHLRTYASKFILSSPCKKQLRKSEYSTIYPEIFRSYALGFNWSYWGSSPEYDPFQPFFCFTLFQLARYGDEFILPEEYALGFFDAFPTLIEDLMDDDDPLEAIDYFLYLYVIQVVIHFWGFFGLVEFEDPDARTNDMPRIRATPLFRELIQFPADWFVDR